MYISTSNLILFPIFFFPLFAAAFWAIENNLIDLLDIFFRFFRSLSLFSLCNCCCCCFFFWIFIPKYMIAGWTVEKKWHTLTPRRRNLAKGQTERGAYGNIPVDKFVHHYFQYKFHDMFPVIVEAGKLQYVNCTQYIAYETFKTDIRERYGITFNSYVSTMMVVKENVPMKWKE